MLWRLAAGCAAVMTTGTGSGYRGVIHTYLRPAIRCVTIFAIICRSNMLRRFTCRIGPVVATRTVAGHTSMINIHLGPAAGDMTGITAVV